MLPGGRWGEPGLQMRDGLREVAAQGRRACEGWDLNACLCLFCSPRSVASGATSVCLSLSSVPGHRAEGVALLPRYDQAGRLGGNSH